MLKTQKIVKAMNVALAKVTITTLTKAESLSSHLFIKFMPKKLPTKLALVTHRERTASTVLYMSNRFLIVSNFIRINSSVEVTLARNISIEFAVLSPCWLQRAEKQKKI